MPTDQPYLDNSSSTLSSPVILGYIKLPVKLTNTTPTVAFPQQGDSYSRGLESMEIGPLLKPTHCCGFLPHSQHTWGITLQIKLKAPTPALQSGKPQEDERICPDHRRKCMRPAEPLSCEEWELQKRRPCRWMSDSCPTQAQHQHKPQEIQESIV